MAKEIRNAVIINGVIYELAEAQECEECAFKVDCSCMEVGTLCTVFHDVSSSVGHVFKRVSGHMPIAQEIHEG